MLRIYFILFTSLILLGCNSNKRAVGSKVDDVLEVDSIDGVYIPKDLDDCFLQLDSFWNDSIKNDIKANSENDFLTESHFGIGRWIRNNWGLWGEKGSRLSKYFNEKGAYHPDDISSVILTSYYRHLQNKPIELEKQISYYDFYWKVNREPNKKDYPKGLNTFNQERTNYSYEKDSLPGCLQIFTDEETGCIWLYDYYYGWKNIDESILREIESNAPLKQNFVEGLFDK